MLGLESFALKDTQTIEIKDARGHRITFPTKETIGKPEAEVVYKPWTVEVMRASSREAQQFRNAQKSKKLATARHGQELTVEELDADGLDLLVFCIVGWDNLCLEGKHQPYSDELARKILLNPQLCFVKDQIDRAAGKDSDYQGNLDRSSST